MILFYILAAVMTALAVAVLIRPLLRAMPQPAGAAEHGQTVYRDQLAELDRDVARGLLSPQEDAAARAEISRRMLAAARAAGPETERPTVPPARRLALAALVVPVAAVAVYLAVGRPGAPDRPLQARLDAGETRAAGASTQMEAALAELSERLREDPEDIEAQILMGRVLVRLSRYDEALTHYETAIELVEAGGAVELSDAALKSEYAQTRVMASDGSVDTQSMELFREVLEDDPNNPEALFFLGRVMAEAGEYDLAYRLWNRLIEVSPPDAPWAGAVRAQLQALPQPGAAVPGHTPAEPADDGAAPQGE